MQIVNLFYQLARQHRAIQGFRYGKGYEKGAGDGRYPLMWLDDPIYTRAISTSLQYTCNVDFLDIPGEGKSVAAVQAAAQMAGLAVAEKIKSTRSRTGFTIVEVNAVTLCDYYDDNAAGWRFTYTLSQANPVDLCADEFDPGKEFPTISALPDFSVDNPGGCAIFSEKTGLPDFKLRR